MPSRAAPEQLAPVRQLGIEEDDQEEEVEHDEGQENFDGYCEDVALMSAMTNFMRASDIPHIRSILKHSHTQTMHIDQLPHLHNVLCRKRGEIKGSICPWHAIKPSGCRKADRCTFPHEDRKQGKCPMGWAKGTKCSMGAFCPYRHKDDVYELWIAEKGGMCRLRILKDLKSKFSQHNKRARMEGSTGQGGLPSNVQPQ
jgi:hypothetical protein